MIWNDCGLISETDSMSYNTTILAYAALIFSTAQFVDLKREVSNESFSRKFLDEIYRYL